MRNNVKLLCLFVFFGMGCQTNNSVCHDVEADKYFKNTGYVFYFQDSQDGMRDFLFFPACSKSGRFKSDCTFDDYEFRTGISFKLPLTGKLYKELSKNRYECTIYEAGIPKKIYFSPVLIEFDRPENSTLSYTSSIENWKLNLNFDSGEVRLAYFVSNLSNIKLMQPLVSHSQ